ncbi:dihydrodipicolinate synthase family protein [Arthrobacter cheniae]|uniref:Dihydrodipicolinate synthase family protein n=1 Tax=Arthrobacter cheniae TaxID=1258888 RepID=A0A3A5M2G8_9MICC|nr:dihydrodipicolinate synthase family protein [Arthrobacter cheniae]RJT78458.1 dihydrodipicolinate synthase family protein [Arthrobacter cheniae]
MITLVDAAGTTSAAELNPAPAFTRPVAPLASRTVYAAAHVVPRTTSDNVPGAPADLDWDATLAFRHHLWSWGLGVADAMDTAQRNMGLDPAATRELISRSAAEARSVGGALVVGVNTDHVDDAVITLDAVIDAYKEQLHLTEDAGASVVLMASRHLARAARTAEDYERVYSEVLAAAGAPVILHWLGSAFDPELGTYFGSTDTEAASSTLLKIIANSPDKVAGVKMSLLDAGSERAVRSQLNAPVRMFTGDDFNYVSLIGGDSSGYSHALLGAFAALGPHGSAAVQALDAEDHDAYQRILGPTEALSRQIFARPTFYYKTGVAFLSWLNGHQPGVGMVGGLHAARSLPHLSEIVRLANECGALEQPDLARERWHGLLRVSGVAA